MPLIVHASFNYKMKTVILDIFLLEDFREMWQLLAQEVT